MRPETQKRLIGILEADIAKLDRKINHDRFADWQKVNDEANKKSLESINAKNLKQQATLLLEYDALHKQAAKLWKAIEQGHKNFEKWYDELSALQRDLSDLKRSFAYPIH